MLFICSIKNEQDAQTVIVADHFYDVNYLEELAEKDYSTVKTSLIIYIVINAILFGAFFAVLVITFKFLSVKSLSMVPLISLIALTICAALFIIQIIRLNVINQLINGEYQINVGLLKLIIFKLKNTKDDIGGCDLINEIGLCCKECTASSSNRENNDKDA